MQELSERRALVQRKQEINADLEKREKLRREAMAAPSMDTGGKAQGSQHTITEADIEEEQEKIASYEAAFRESVLARNPSGLRMCFVYRWLTVAKVFGTAWPHKFKSDA